MSNNYHDPYNLSITLHPDSDFEAEPNIIHRARKYMARMEAAVAGAEGHTALFKVACALVRVFALVFGDVLKLLIEYNHRCEPPWTLEELRHKAAEADRLVEPAGNRDLLESTRTNPMPYLGGFREFDTGDIFWLAQSRKIPEIGIKLAVERDFLSSGMWYGMECYALSDVSGNLIELRRMNGEFFPAVPEYNLGERKCHTVRNSKKGWPIGIIESEPYEAIALVEGGPDFLYAHYRVVQEGSQDRVAVVAMLSSSPYIVHDSLKWFRGKPVRIFPHLDEAGLVAGQKWQKQLLAAGAREVDIFELSGLTSANGDPIGDLCELTTLSPEALAADQTLRRILP